MKKILFQLSVFALTAVSAFAQADDYKKAEFFVGYSNQQVDAGVDPGDFDSFVRDRESFNGFNVSGVYNVSRYIGVKADFSGAYKGRSFNFSPPGGNVSFDADASLYNFLGGLQLKDNSTEKRVKPFGHILAGAGHGRVKVSNLNCSVGVDCTGLNSTLSETGFAAAIGGGVDIKLNNRVDLRLIQVDYNPVFFDNGTNHNVRFGIGFVFK